MPLHRQPGRHELGQNALTNPHVIRAVVDLVARTDGPIVEWGAGDGALTDELARLGRGLEVVEIDRRKAIRLSRRLGPHVCIIEGDILRHAPPPGTSVLVSNVPFHITTPVLRRLLACPDWQTAVLITQWEVARKRAGVGGATQLTAQWWPWFEFSLKQRIPSSSFTPSPSVDAGLLTISRRPTPLITSNPAPYQSWVRRVFTGRGHGLAEVLPRAAGIPTPVATRWCRQQQLTSHALPRDLNAYQWTELYALSQQPQRHRRELDRQ